MTAAAPVARAAAGRAAGSSASKAGASAAAGRAATTKAGAGTAAGRARALMDGGASRAQAKAAIRKEYGATAAEVDGLLDDLEPAAAPEPRTPAPARSGPSLPSAPKAMSSAASAGGGAILAVFSYVLALTYLRGGLPGVKRWMRAKFLNQVTP